MTTYCVTFQQATSFEWQTLHDVTSDRLRELLADADEGDIVNVIATQESQ